MAIVYSVVAQQSLGELLAGSVFPGFCCPASISATSRCAATSIPSSARRCRRRSASSFREKLRLLSKTLAPIMLIMLVLGVIFFGIATPVEAAGIGTFGALFVCAMHRRLTWDDHPRGRASRR